jgi:hypothetical protein
VYTLSVQNGIVMNEWIVDVQKKLDSVRDTAAMNTRILEEVQDKYAGESFENRDLFIYGIIAKVLDEPTE